MTMLTSAAAEVFQTIHQGSGWSDLGLSLLVGQSAIMFLIVGRSQSATNDPVRC